MLKCFQKLKQTNEDIHTFIQVLHLCYMLDLCPSAFFAKSKKIQATTTHLHTIRAGCVCVELPPERAQPGYCCRLKRCLYGTRVAPQQWERFAAAALERLGLRRGSASAVRFHHTPRDSMGLVHRDHFMFSGADVDLDWATAELPNDILLNAMGSWVATITRGRAGGQVPEPRHQVAPWRAGGGG